MILENALIGTVDIQVPDVSDSGFYLSRSKLGTRMVDNAVPAWRTLTSNATRVSIRRGASARGLVPETDVGIMSFTLYNDEDPLVESLLRPGDAIRASLTLEGQSYPLFTGNILDIEAEYPLNKNTGEERTFVNFTAVDAVRTHTQTSRSGVRGSAGGSHWTSGMFAESFEERIARLAASSRAPIDVPPLKLVERTVWSL